MPIGVVPTSIKVLSQLLHCNTFTSCLVVFIVLRVELANKGILCIYILPRFDNMCLGICSGRGIDLRSACGWAGDVLVYYLP
jgi:hypothetical protein